MNAVKKFFVVGLIGLGIVVGAMAMQPEAEPEAKPEEKPAIAEMAVTETIPVVTIVAKRPNAIEKAVMALQDAKEAATEWIVNLVDTNTPAQDQRG